ncbi:MAG: tyrosine--tRNA ligase [Candidatus Omnitrophica bacterium CG1_02_49_10]|nr:MAG: tyrosine--tRNA ligase [Candidatus Omnitrophica bacterium CG1_02_49_10]
MDVKKQIDIIKRGTSEIISEKELAEKIASKKRLVVKAGFDPSAPDIHLGHTVLLRKLRHFQDLGHEVVFLIGDFTGMIGDPSGASITRKRLSRREVSSNARTYREQVSKILDIKKLKVVFNSRWLGKMKLEAVMELASKQTVARVLERDDFMKRYKEGKDISFLEFLYPLFQGYDSVELKSDVEIGGTDQKFNMLMGRTLQKRYGEKEQAVITMPLLEGTDGIQKMSKSLDNYIGINEDPKDIYGKLMSISDELMFKYYELLTDEDLGSVRKMHPMEAKKKLAHMIVSQYHGGSKAEAAAKDFEKKFQKGDFGHLELQVIPVPGPVPLLDFLAGPQACNAGSKSHVRRLIEQGAVEVNGEKIRDTGHKLGLEKDYEIKAGKKIFKRVKFKGLK